MLKFILELILLELYDIVFTKVRIRCYHWYMEEMYQKM